MTYLATIALAGGHAIAIILAALLLLTTTLALYLWQIARDRAANLETLLKVERAANAKLQLAIAEHLETTELMLEHMTELERRNMQLERKGVVWVVKP